MANRIWVGNAVAHQGDWSWDDSGASFATSNWIDETGAKVAKPADGDDVYFENASRSVTSGYGQSAITLGSLNIAQSYTGEIGSTSAYMQVSADVVNIGLQGQGANGTGSRRIKLDLGSDQATVNVLATSASSLDTGLPVVRLLGTHASNVLNVVSGSVGVAATSSGEVSTMAAVNVGAGIVTLGAGCSLTAIDIGKGGRVTNLGAAATTVNVCGTAAIYTAYGSGAHTTINVDAGSVVYNSSGTITTAAVLGTLDLSSDPAGKTITNCKVYKGATLLLSNGTPLAHTFTNGIDLVRCGMADVAIDFGTNYTIAFSTI